MKTILLSAFLLLVTSTFAQNYVPIPDANFAKWLRDSVPTAMNGNQLDISSDAVKNKKTIIAESLGINDFRGVEYFTNLESLYIGSQGTSDLLLPVFPATLKYLNCAGNNLTTLPELPSNLQFLKCNYNKLTSIPQFSNSLIEIDCSANYLTTLPNLPNSVVKLNCSLNGLKSLPSLPINMLLLDCLGNDLSSLPELPQSLQTLYCNNNQIVNMPVFPSMLTYVQCEYNNIESFNDLGKVERLSCDHNQLKTLPTLPTTLRALYCENNLLSSLPLLPSSLEQINCNNNQIEQLPELPNNLIFLQCNFNKLTSLPQLPSKLLSLDCSNNMISCFPKFPISLVKSNLVKPLDLSNNPFTCLPNYVSGMDLVTLSYPLCIEGNSSGCPNAEEGIVGFTSLDDNVNCKKDINEKGIQNVPVQLLNANNNVIGQTITAENGVYQFSTLDAQSYQVQLDKENLPFSIVCNDKQAVDLTNQTYAKDINFSATCKDGIDVGIRSVATEGIIFPGQPHILTVAAGDMSNWYNMHCAAGTAGKLQLTISGPVVYKGVMAEALTPTIVGNVYTYDIADFGKVNFTEDFGLQFETETTAQAGDQICVDAQITPTSGDINVANNQYTYCYSVVNSHDPNVKEVFPANFKPGYDGYLTYTIHFQNTGSAPAFNIRLLDTLDAKLDLSTFEVLNYSHKNRVELKGNIMQVFYNNIHLMDSTTNEKESHGFIQYRIKPKTAITESDQIKNTAHIYFDYNDAVVTNTTISKATKSLGLETQNVSILQAYPNPVESTLTLKRGSNSIEKLQIQITNINGQAVYETTLSSEANHTIDVAGFVPGMYFINIKTETSNEVIKVIKK